MIADSRGQWAAELKRRADAVANLPEADHVAALAKMRRRTDPKRVPMRDVEFMQKAFAQVTAEDINDFIESLLDSVARATADRYVDVLSQVINWAIKKKGLKVAMHPMDGVTRPRYRNERDRRVGVEEEERLLSALVAEDSRRYARTCARYEAQKARGRAVGVVAPQLSRRWKRCISSLLKVGCGGLKHCGWTGRISIWMGARLISRTPKTGTHDRCPSPRW